MVTSVPDSMGAARSHSSDSDVKSADRTCPLLGRNQTREAIWLMSAKCH
jgi:hypothetical protein